jgi:cytochrome c556
MPRSLIFCIPLLECLVNFNKTVRARGVAIGVLIMGTIMAIAAYAQSPASGGVPSGRSGAHSDEPTPGERAIKYRRAVYTVIGGNFRPVGGMLQGTVPFNAADALKRAQRVKVMAGFLDEAFPDISKAGDTEAKPEIWTNRVEFDKLVKDFNADTAALVATLEKDNKSDIDAFKSAAKEVAADCKGCHEKFRAK